MEKRGKQGTRKRKTQIPEEDDKQNESILEEVLNISGKNIESSAEKDESPPARLKRSANKVKEKVVTQPKKGTAKKLPVSSSLPASKKKKPTDEEKEVNNANEDKTSTSEKGYPVPNLPDGWRREISVRKSGKTAGQIDIYFYSPAGKKLRSRPDVASYLTLNKINLNLKEFDFSKKTAESVEKKKNLGNSTTPRKKSKIQQEEKVDVVESKETSKAVSAKKSKSSEKTSSKVPPADAEEKNDADTKSNRVLIDILESKHKKYRK